MNEKTIYYKLTDSGYEWFHALKIFKDRKNVKIIVHKYSIEAIHTEQSEMFMPKHQYEGHEPATSSLICENDFLQAYQDTKNNMKKIIRSFKMGGEK